LTLPLSIPEAVLGKFFAAWAFTAVALALTFPIWISVNVLGRPDNGVIVAGYLGSFVMAGAFLAVGSCMSALTKNQVIAFVLACAACFLFILSGTPLVLGFAQSWLPQVLVDAVASFSFLTHFNAIKKGVIDLRDVVFLASLITLFLFANVVLVDLKKSA